MSEELWKLHVHNAAHGVLHELQDLHTTFLELSEEKAAVLDSYVAVDRQLALLRSESRRLTELLGRITR